MGDRSVIELVTINEGITTRLSSIKDKNTIYMTSTSKGRTIKDIDGSSGEFDKVGIMNINSTKVSKSTKSKDFV